VVRLPVLRVGPEVRPGRRDALHDERTGRGDPDPQPGPGARRPPVRGPGRRATRVRPDRTDPAPRPVAGHVGRPDGPPLPAAAADARLPARRGRREASRPADGDLARDRAGVRPDAVPALRRDHPGRTDGAVPPPVSRPPRAGPGLTLSPGRPGGYASPVPGPHPG